MCNTNDSQIIKELQVEVMLLKDEQGIAREERIKLITRMDRQRQSLDYLWHFFYVLKTERK